MKGELVMAKLTKITIVNPTTIRLDQDANIGDEINLLDISSIDASIIDKKISEEVNKEIEKKVNETKQILKIEKENEINKLILELQEKNASINETLKTEILQLKNEIANFETIKKAQIELAIKDATILSNKETELLNKKIIELESSLEVEKLKNNAILEQALLKKDLEYQTKISEQDKIINDLRLAKSSLNIKKMGEQLESWCNMEYENYAQCGFEMCTWYKDNDAIIDELDSKKTKADYIFKVYASSSHNENELLTSVACEMKNESPNSTNKKKNSDHFLKLDKDRKKKGCEYALLISELEWDQANDVPIRKVVGYEKMYVVRPQYFITFLSIVTALSLKFKDLIIDEIKEKEAFKDSSEIKAEFEKFKNDLLDKPLVKLEKELSSIIDNANNIKKYTDKIIDSATSLISKTLKDIENRINNFKIDKLCKKISKLE